MAEENIDIYIMGKKYSVPKSLTIMKAMEYAGYMLVRGCGCRGGFCGACGTVYRTTDDYKIKVGLACQAMVEDGMYLTQIPFFPANKAVYDIEKMKPTGEQVLKEYPELARCVACNTCTKICPQDIQVMDYVQAALRGDIARVADLSFDCIMCGLCAVRCPAEIVQYNIAVLCRRLYGKYVAKKAKHLQEMVAAVGASKFDDELGELMSADQDKLKQLYKDRDMEPR
ncbi:4Fe-4S dicluster domain-containing protein [candidate division TA06 bacterium]|uniref:4Fe-4S dicluster domain-containing protein n=1 Tax=candidate division TA06 bacterium TaxID=2250710 RepID=A0A523UXS4_UNCT6|nr:MAG: 4Fe-4S dicluster domain-containing protein [candidate division TA06 bacterium]